MKFSKKIMMTLFICFFVSGAVFTIVSSKELKIDIDNAIQTVQNIILFSGDNEGKLTVEYAKLKIFGDNFVISSGNKIIRSEKSSILGGSGNKIEGGNGSTILGGEGNIIVSDNSFIGGGSKNNIYDATGSVIMGGKGNNVFSEYSLAIGNNNTVNSSNAVVVGNNNVVEVSNSVAMGSGAIVRGNNSFIWSDGTDEAVLDYDDVFAVISEKGMVVGDIAVDIAAKLNVGSAFMISTGEADNNIQCGNGDGAGIIKVVDRDDIPDQKCLCSCNGEKWISMLGDGQCESICKGETTELFPGCPEGKGISKFLSGDGKEYFLGECLSGTVIEGSYYMTGDTVYRVCQSKNGNVTTCNYKSECKGTIPENARKNNNIVPSIDLSDDDSARIYAYNEDKSQICSYSCNEGYAYQDFNRCINVCGPRNCNLGSYIPGSATLRQDYTYGCKYNEKTYTCNVECETGQIWNGSACIFEREICGNEKYTCSYGEVYDTGTDLMNFTWNCKSDGGNIGKSCSKAKETVNKSVYYSNKRVNGQQLVYFYVKDNDITRDINIKLEYKNNGTSIGKYPFTIPATGTSSKKETFGSDLVLERPIWGVNNGCSVENQKLYMPIGEKVYVLEIKDDNSSCLASCSTAGQCANGATRVGLLSHSLLENQAEFRWSCSKGGSTENCIATCKVDKGQGTSTMPENAENCDPSSDRDCNILGGDGDIALDNVFYMDVTDEKIVASKCGDKRRCVNVGGNYITCNKSRETCVQQGFKCKKWYTLSGGVCKLDICDSSQSPGKCKIGQVLNGGATGTSGYSYRCRRGTGTQTQLCAGKCDNDKVWNGTGCVLTKKLCGSGHYNCINGARAESTQPVDSKHKYSWTCRLGDSYESCMEAYTGYKCKDDQDICVKIVNDCEAEKDTEGYSIPFMKNGTQTGVQKYTRNSVCDKTVKCETGEVKKISEKCKNVCNTGTYLGTCITGFNVYWSAYNGNTAESMYNYICWDSVNQKVFADNCYAKCPTRLSKDLANQGKMVNTYWIGDRCKEFIIGTGYNPGGCDDDVCRYNLCDENHYNCKNGAKLVSQSESSEEKKNQNNTTTTYTWKCYLGDLSPQTCMEKVVKPNGCKKIIITGGYIIKVDMNHGQQLTVMKSENGKTCTGTAVCQTGSVNIKNETCTNKCPGGVLDKPKCNYGGNPSSYQEATWTSGYTYMCEDVQCRANCPDNKVWNGNACITIGNIMTCDNSTANKCNIGKSSTVSNGTRGNTWNCKDINGNNLNTGLCYKCNNGYLWNSSENKCTSICGNGASNSLCNWGYIATGQVWGNGYTLWGGNYQCKSGSQTVQCNCPSGTVWDGSCKTLRQDLCNNSKKDGCYDSYSVNQKTITGGYTWDCKNAIKTQTDCHLCNDGEWDEQTKTCKSSACGGIEPEGSGVIKNSHYGNGPTNWMYVDDPDFNVMSAGCTWICDEGYTVNDDETGCILDTGPQCGSAITDNGTPRKNKNNLCAQGNYSNGKVVFSYNGRNGQRCVPYYQWKCSKGGESITCKSEEINVAGVGLSYPDSDYHTYWEIGSYYNGLYPYYGINSNDVTDGLHMTLIGYADADPQGSNTTVLAPNLSSYFEKTLKAGEHYSNQDITNWSNNDLYCFVGISFEPKIYRQSDGDEFIIYPTFDRAHITAFSNCQSSVCPSEFLLDPS